MLLIPFIASSTLFSFLCIEIVYYKYDCSCIHTCMYTHHENRYQKKNLAMLSNDTTGNTASGGCGITSGKYGLARDGCSLASGGVVKLVVNMV